MMLAFSASAFAQRTTDFRDCPRFFVNETPPSVTNISAWHPRALCFDSFAVMHSGQTRTPLYVAERLNRDRLMDARHERRTDRFYEEARLPRSERSQLSDYAHSGYDRGHLAPAGDQPNTMAMAQSFSLSNMIPQASENNRGPWADIEKATRKYAMRARGDVYVITGPVFTENSQSIGANHVRVPDYIYKLVYDASTNRAWAHWIENTNEAEIRRPISYAELVKRTGIDFLPGVRPE
jgi:endonuclease G